MKKEFLSVSILVIAIALFFGCSGKSGESQESDSTTTPAEETSETTPETGAKYGVKSGIITYTPFEMMGVKTYDILYFDDYGKKEARETISEMNLMGMKTKTRGMSISKDGYSITYELENIVNNQNQLKKEAVRTKVPDMGIDNKTFATVLSIEMKESMDYKEEGQETVAGITGTKYSICIDKNKPDFRVYGVVYKNIVLKTEMQNIKIVAQKAEFDVAVPQDKFEVPSDYKIIDAPEY